MDRLLRSKEWPAFYKKLLAFAFYKTRSHDESLDLVQEALSRVCDPAWSPWDPATHPDLKRFLMSIVNRLVSNERTSAARRYAVDLDDEARSKLVDEGSSLEDDASKRELLARRWEALRSRLKEDVLASRLVDLLADGVDGHHEQAHALGCTAAEARSARRRVAHHAAIVAREIGGASAPAGAADDDGDDEEVAQ